MVVASSEDLDSIKSPVMARVNPGVREATGLATEPQGVEPYTSAAAPTATATYRPGMLGSNKTLRAAYARPATRAATGAHQKATAAMPTRAPRAVAGPTR